MAGGRSAESKTVGSDCYLPPGLPRPLCPGRVSGNANTLSLGSFNKYLLSTYCCVAKTDKKPCSQGAPTQLGGKKPADRG